MGKVLEIWHALSGGPRDATAYALLTDAGDERSGDRAKLQAFLATLEGGRGLAGSQAGVDP
jgi:hypothetical protein